MPVLLIGTLDTKGVEFAFVRDLLRAAGVGVPRPRRRRPAARRPSRPTSRATRSIAAAGTSLDAVRAGGDRGQAVDRRREGRRRHRRALHAEGKLDGVLGLGGSAGTTIGTAAMRALPFGVPKLMVSTLASGQVRPYVGVRDVMMMYSVVDISGLNRISRTVLANAANAMIGMVRAGVRGQRTEVRRQAADHGDDVRRDDAVRRGGAGGRRGRPGYEVLVFHATGTGGQTMESFVRDGLIARRARHHDDRAGRRAGRRRPHGRAGPADGGGAGAACRR